VQQLLHVAAAASAVDEQLELLDLRPAVDLA